MSDTDRHVIYVAQLAPNVRRYRTETAFTGLLGELRVDRLNVARQLAEARISPADKQYIVNIFGVTGPAVALVRKNSVEITYNFDEHLNNAMGIMICNASGWELSDAELVRDPKVSPLVVVRSRLAVVRM